jgi:tetratricopeptide (TPR) repeat protein
VQLGSDAIFGRIPRSIGATVYGALERVAPAPYVEEMLAQNALATNDLEGAQRYALRLPSSASRNELLARIAELRGQSQLALEYYLVAPDVDAVDRYVSALGHTDPIAAYALENELLQRLQALTTHPDAVAEAYWRLGRLSTRRGYLYPHDRLAAWNASLPDYLQAAGLAPLSEKYWLALGNQYLLLGDWPAAKAAFLRAINVHPGSTHAKVGIQRAIAHRAAPW